MCSIGYRRRARYLSEVSQRPPRPWCDRATVPLWAVSACLILLGSAMPTITAAQSQASDKACSAILVGSRFPEAIPTYWTWEEFFTEVARPGTKILVDEHLNPSEQVTVEGRATSALARAKKVRDTAPLPKSAEREVSEVVLSTRDQLIRELSQTAYEGLRSRAHTGSNRRDYLLPIPGKRMSAEAGSHCIVAVKGREQPYLIPEAEHWEFYLRSYALLAEEFRLDGQNYQAVLLTDLARTRLPIRTEYLKRFLDTAVETANALSEITGSADRGRRADLVTRARERLVRAFPESTWAVIQKDVARSIEGMVFHFPPDIRE
jgi:hypothetical protein